MKVYKYLKKLKSGDLYVNAVLVSLVIAFGICITNAYQHKDYSWELLRSKKSGSILLAYVGSAGVLYKDEAGVLQGEGVEGFNKFLNNAEGNFNVKIIPEVKNFSNVHEVTERIKASNGGVFGWNINEPSDPEILTISFPGSSNERQDKPALVALKASSDWLPVLASYITQNGGADNLNRWLPDAEAMPDKSAL